ncbi:MAG: tetrathionate reductase family octaheme c-type cytochrome [Sedimenticola sp.]|nr:tetrathionate reductase family octaheme c-type cytochrome [Sedimenticola sp.]
MSISCQPLATDNRQTRAGTLIPLCILLLVWSSLLWLASAQASVDHSRWLKGPYSTGPDVTRACLACHQRQAEDFSQDAHWNWIEEQELAGHREWVAMGKRNLLNNFCIGVPSNWPRCTSCHAGYGWEDESFDFSKLENIDCLVCHDTTGDYRKAPTGAGHPEPGLDLTAIARKVGRTSRISCGSCHFFGGGGDHVKHGDLDSSLANPRRSQDVHMGVDGPDMSCQFCHQTRYHEIPGQAMSVSGGEGLRVECGGCHRGTPHDDATLDRHSRSVACQTCHIPSFANSFPTKVWQDWSHAGEERTLQQGEGIPTFTKNQGEMRWEQSVIPTYAWYNGQSARYLPGDRIEPAQPVLELTRPLGDITQEEARIHPFKVMEGKQPFDVENRYLVIPKLYRGFWEHYDWDRAIREGMSKTDLDYSGRYDFIHTRMYWRINHMVVPKEAALQCDDCHSESGRLDWKALGYPGDPIDTGSRTLQGR